MEDATPTDRPGRGSSRRTRDLVISLLVLLVPVVLLVGGYQLFTGRNQPVEVDPAPALAQARAAGLAAAEPAGLAGGWVPVSAAVREFDDGVTLRLGYTTPQGESAQLVQSTVAAERLLAEVLAEAGPPTGTVEVRGHPWQRYQTRPGEHALVLLEPEQTTIVIGTGTDSELRHLAAALT